MKMSQEQAKKKIDEGLKRLNEALAEGRSEELEQYLEIMGKFHRYSFNNIMLILMQCPDASHVAGFGTWKQLGRSVKKGEKGIAIVAPCRYKQKEEDESGEEQTSYALRGFRVAYVYDVAQTDGDELPEIGNIEGDPGAALQQLKDYIEELGVSLAYHPSLGPGCQGLSGGGSIDVVEGLSAGTEFSVLIHELAHEELHHGDRRHQTDKKTREVEAEGVAAVVCSAFGIDSTRRSADYLSMYRGDASMLGESLSLIQKTAEKIIDGVGSQQTEAVAVQAPDDHQVIEQTPAEPLRVGRADYEEIQEAKIDRYHELADKRRVEANSTHDEARRMASVIPFGQPILVGHHSEKRDRNYRDRIHRKFGKAFELGDKAKYWENRAEAAESGNAISSDDPKALEKLKAKLADLEDSQESMKGINKAWRSCGRPGPDDKEGWQKIAEHAEVNADAKQLDKLRVAYARLLQWQGRSAPFPSYSLSNNSAEIRRIRSRINQLVAAASAEHKDVDRGLCRYVENPDLNRVQLCFDGKPSEEIRKVLKSNGFRFSRRDGNAWQRHLNSQGVRAAEYVIAEIKKLGNPT